MSQDIAVSSRAAGFSPFSTSTAIIGAGSQRRSTPSRSISRAWGRSRDMPSILRFVVEPLADHLGDTGAHGDAVEGVGYLHGALLVRDDQKLALLPQLREERNQPAEVNVVEGRLHLVHDVEGRGAGPEDGAEHGHRGQ